jgi:XTP/dITP diphosphohydrolase
MKIVIATDNRGKILEIAKVLSGVPGINLFSKSDVNGLPHIDEDGDTFEANAIKKADIIAGISGLPAMADDSGLIVDALGGRPGIFSARFGGPNLSDAERNQLLLSEMTSIQNGNRTARFICVIAVAIPGRETHISVGVCEGKIAAAPSGKNGFGYDPVFFLPSLGKTMAELSIEQKNRISHRAKALVRARDYIMRLAENES